MASTRSALVALLGLSLAPPPVADASPPSVATLVVELDRLHGRRDDPATEKALEARLAEALAAAPASPDVLWRAARFEIWRGDGTRDATRQRAHGERAAALARKAAALAPGRVEGHYFAAIGVGLYAQAVGVWKTVREGRDKEFTRALDQALKLDPFYDRGGPLVMKGRYHYEMPWPMRDLDRSAEHLRRALAKFPHNRRARIFLAETLLKDGEPAQAKQALDPVFTPRPEEDPPEDRRARKLAEAVAAKIAKELR
jgi:ParB-like chromosome segregation protein Spo0J